MTFGFRYPLLQVRSWCSRYWVVEIVWKTQQILWIRHEVFCAHCHFYSTEERLPRFCSCMSFGFYQWIAFTWREWIWTNTLHVPKNRIFVMQKSRLVSFLYQPGWVFTCFYTSFCISQQFNRLGQTCWTKVLAEDHSAPVRQEPLVQSPQLGKLERGPRGPRIWGWAMP